MEGIITEPHTHFPHTHCTYWPKDSLDVFDAGEVKYSFRWDILHLTCALMQGEKMFTDSLCQSNKSVPSHRYVCISACTIYCFFLILSQYWTCLHWSQQRLSWVITEYFSVISFCPISARIMSVSLLGFDMSLHPHDSTWWNQNTD